MRYLILFAILSCTWLCPTNVYATAVGYVDNVDSEGNVGGWALDPQNPQNAAMVYFYLDGPAPSSGSAVNPVMASDNSAGTYIGKISTFYYRPDVDAAFGITGNHGFSFPLSSVPFSPQINARIQNSLPHVLYIYAVPSGMFGDDLSQLAPIQPSPNPAGLWVFTDTRGHFSTRVSTATPWNFQILVDLNQLQRADFAGNPSLLKPLAADGVWAITVNSPDLSDADWTGILSNLNASNWLVSEDNPTSATDYNRLSRLMGHTVNGSFNYFEDTIGFFNTLNETGYYTTLSHGQISTNWWFQPNMVPTNHQISDIINGNNDAAGGHYWEAHPGVSGKIIVHTRSYGQGDPRRNLVDLALADARTSGAAIELTSEGGGETSFDWWTALDVNGFVNANIKANKKAYILMPSVSGSESRDYLFQVQSIVPYLAEHNLLENKNLYFVLADYGRFQPPYTGVLKGDDDTSPDNSLLAAKNWLQELRSLPVQSTKFLGFIDGINQNVLQGWACMVGSMESIPVHVYLGGPVGQGGKMWKTFTPNGSNEPAVSKECGTSGTQYRFNIELPTGANALPSGQKIFMYAMSPLGIGETTLANSGVYSTP
jgi:hypothetical protein